MEQSSDRVREPGSDSLKPNVSQLRNKARRAMKRFEKAVRAHAFRGAQPVEDWEDIDREFNNAKRELANYLQYIP